MYTEQQLIGIAKRENNTKRRYLVVNRLQGKHVPVSPTASLKMFGELADKIKNGYNGEKLLLIGFAETATAIGSALAAETGSLYIQTTREDIEDVEYLYFSEQHSHATNQKIVRDDIDKIIAETDRIVFVEDEVTTGNTILNIINVIENEYKKRVKFSVASIINGMDELALSRFKERRISVHYLLKTNNADFDKGVDIFADNGNYFKAETSDPTVSAVEAVLSGHTDARRLTNGTEYLAACDKLCTKVKSLDGLSECKSLLVIGTEEFMFPAMYVAAGLEKDGHEVKFHATTRSPISVSKAADYPLSERYELISLYENERTTFIYNIEKHDAILIITDAPDIKRPALNTLLNAVEKCGNDLIYLIKWE